MDSAASVMADPSLITPGPLWLSKGPLSIPHTHTHKHVHVSAESCSIGTVESRFTATLQKVNGAALEPPTPILDAAICTSHFTTTCLIGPRETRVDRSIIPAAVSPHVPIHLFPPVTTHFFTCQIKPIRPPAPRVMLTRINIPPKHMLKQSQDTCVTVIYSRCLIFFVRVRTCVKMFAGMKATVS